MKKALIIGTVVYSVLGLGVGVWMLLKPEAYGEWIGKMTGAMFKGLAEAGGEI